MGSTVPAALARYLMCGKGIRLRFVLAVVLAATGLAVPAASASSSGGLLGGLLPPCGATTFPFKAWGASAAYCAFPNLGFESGATEWTLSGKASIVTGNEPWHVSGSGTHALQLAPGATAQSATLPVNLLDPWVRLFAHSSGANGSLRVQVVFRGLLGNLTGVLNVGSLSPGSYSSWQPTQRVLSSLALPVLTTSAQGLPTSPGRAGARPAYAVD